MKSTKGSLMATTFEVASARATFSYFVSSQGEFYVQESLCLIHFNCFKRRVYARSGFDARGFRHPADGAK